MVKALVQPKKSGVLPTKGKSSKSPFARRPVSTESEGFARDEPFSVSESVQPDWGSIPINAPDATPFDAPNTPSVQAQEETEEKEIQEKEDKDNVQLKESAIASSEDEDNKIQAKEEKDKLQLQADAIASEEKEIVHAKEENKVVRKGAEINLVDSQISIQRQPTSELLGENKSKNLEEKSNLPQPLPNYVGNVNYYQARYKDYQRRHNSFPPPPDYYLNYGDKYARRFTQDLRPKLSKQGQKWLDQAFVLLQKAIEDKVQEDPVAFDLLEQDSEQFKDFVYDTHPSAYLNAGLLELPSKDLAFIVLTPDLKDILNQEGLDQIMVIAKHVQETKEDRYICDKLSELENLGLLDRYELGTRIAQKVPELTELGFNNFEEVSEYIQNKLPELKELGLDYGKDLVKCIWYDFKDIFTGGEEKTEQSKFSSASKYIGITSPDAPQSIEAPKSKQKKIQPKLSIGKPGDKYEQEADRVARKVIEMDDRAPQPSVQRKTESPNEKEKNIQQKPLAQTIAPLVQRQTPQPEEKESSINAKGQNTNASANFESTLSQRKGGGSSLGNETKDFMESRFGADFSGVRVHTDSSAVQMNKDIGAQAFTHGKDIFFNAGKFNPGSNSGKELLAHELTHTIQQTGGAVQAKCEKCEAEEKVQRQPIAPSSETETVRAFGLGDIGQGITSIGEGIGDAWDAGTEWVGDRVEDLQELGEDAFPALIGNLSPELASLISNGGLGLIQEELESGLEGWMEGLFGGTSIDDTLLQFQGEIGGIFGEVQGLTEDSESNCEAFAQKIEAFRGFIQRLMENPVIQTLQDGLSTITSAFQQVQDLILAPVFDTLMDLAGGVFNEVIGYAQTLWEWGAPIRDFLGKAWDWVLRQLGISGDGEGGIVNWIKEKASEIWTDLQERFAPVIEPLKTMLGVMVALSPAGLIIGATQYAPQLIESIQWLWANKDNPDIIKSAHAEMGHTILPQLLDGVQGFSNGLQSGVNFFIEQLAGVSESVLGLLGAVSGIPIVSIAQNLLQTISDGVSGLATWSQETLKAAVDATVNFAKQVREKVAPYAEVLSSLGVALVNPGMIPMILAGNAWLIIPDCYKAPIIDLILDTLIGILSTTSELPTFGPIWQLLQTGILGFLEGVRAQETDTKVAISNKIAKIISGRSLDFILGFVQGLLKGIWEGISDPFVLAYQGITAIGALGDWVMSLIGQPKQGMQPEGGNAIADSTVMAMMETGEAVEEGGSVDRGGNFSEFAGNDDGTRTPSNGSEYEFHGGSFRSI
jgi:hypothetical protein